MRFKSVAIGVVVFLASITLLADWSPSVSSVKVRPVISFEGLVALVKSPAFDRGAVVAVDPTRSSLHSYLPKHAPILVIPMAAIKNGKPDAFTDETQQFGIWRLNDARVSFRSSVAGNLITPVRSAGDAPYPRTREEWRDVKWIVDMERLTAGKGGIKSELMTTNDLRGSMLSSRIELPSGTLEATEPPEPWNGSEVRFLPLEGKLFARPHQQAATQRLLHTVTPADAFAIVLSPSDGTTPRIVELKGDGEAIPITISNHTTMPTLTNHEMPHQAVHVLAYYDLLSTPVENAVIPTSLVPFPTTRTVASPGFFCDGGSYALTWEFEK